MNKKKYIVKTFALLTLCCILATGCKKETTQVTISTSNGGTQQVIALDEMDVNTAMYQLIDEAVTALSDYTVTSGVPMPDTARVLSPNILIDTTGLSTGTINLDYFVGVKQNAALGRSGTVQVKLPIVAGHVVPWKNTGTSATLNFTNPNLTQDYEVFYEIANTSLWFKNSITVTNYSGGLLKNLTPGDSLVERVNGQIQYTANDNAATLVLWTWNLHHARVIGMTNANHITITTRADTNVNGFTNVVTWGQDRFNDNFYTSLTTPLFQDITSSNFYSPLSGVKLIENIVEPLTCTYGVDANGNPVVNGTPYGYELNWTNNGAAQNLLVGYQQL